MADHVPGPIESLLANGTRELAAVAALVSLHPCKCFVGLTAVRTLVARGVEVRVQVVAQMGRTLKQVVQLSITITAILKAKTPFVHALRLVRL